MPKMRLKDWDRTVGLIDAGTSIQKVSIIFGIYRF